MTATALPIRLPALGTLTPGDELDVTRLGRCRYVSAERTDDGEIRWLNVTEARNGASRSITPDRVTDVHRAELAS